MLARVGIHPGGPHLGAMTFIMTTLSITITSMLATLRNSESRLGYTECQLFIGVLAVLMLSVIILNVMAPWGLYHTYETVIYGFP